MNDSLFDSVSPGESWRGAWDSGVPGAPELPANIVRGARTGPRLLLTGAVHGDEYEGPAAIHALFGRLDASRLAGTVIGLPIVNVAAWQARSRVSPADGGDLNRSFPGRSSNDAGYSLRLAEAVFEGCIQHCDALIDLHSGGAALVHLPLIGWYRSSGDEAERIARRFGQPFYPWVLPDTPGVLSYEAQRAGKVALGAEWGGGARLDPEGADAYLAGLCRAMVLLDMVSPAFAHAVPEPDPRRAIAGDYQKTEVGGLFACGVRLGEEIAGGAPIGSLMDLLDGRTTVVRATRGGTVAGLPHISLLRSGDRVAYIG